MERRGGAGLSFFCSAYLEATFLSVPETAEGVFKKQNKYILLVQTLNANTYGTGEIACSTQMRKRDDGLHARHSVRSWGRGGNPASCQGPSLSEPTGKPATPATGCTLLGTTHTDPVTFPGDTRSSHDLMGHGWVKETRPPPPPTASWRRAGVEERSTQGKADPRHARSSSPPAEPATRS